MNPVEWRRRPQGGKNLTSSPRLKPGDSNPSPGRASCFIGPRPPDALPGALAGHYVYSTPAAKDRHHPTEKPLDLMRQLVQIVPPGGTILDPFAGSGTTGVAALAEGRGFIGIELSDHYHRIAEARLAAVQPPIHPQGV